MIGLAVPSGWLDEAAAALDAEAELSPRMVRTWLWCSRRSRIAVAATASPNTVPHSATLRFDVISMAPFSQRRLTNWKT